MTRDRMARRRLSRFALLVVACGSLLAVASPAGASVTHPLGNFTINVYAGVEVRTDAVVVNAAIDMAEIPTVQAKPRIDRNADGTNSASELDAFGSTRCPELASGMGVKFDGRTAPLSIESSRVTIAAGLAGLSTTRVDCRFRSPLSMTDGRHRVEVALSSVADHVGWHEITIAGDGTTITSSNVAATSISRGLTSYPTARLHAPLDERTAAADVRPGGPRLDQSGGGPAQSKANLSAIPGVDDATRSFAGLVAHQHLTLWILFTGVAIAIFLGSLHALAPGHGKTVMAAYLLGREGTPRQALALCAVVTLTHTAGVLVLGTVLTVTTVLAPERLYPLLGTISGLLVASIGVTLLLRVRRHRAARGDRLIVAEIHDHRHSDPDHSHSDGHPHGAGTHTHATLDPSAGWRSMFVMGFAGGMVPSPSALVVLLGAIALGRTWLGVILVIAYGLGMALSLVAAGFLLLRVRARLDRYLDTSRGARAAHLMVRAPLVTAVLVIAGGVWIAARAAIQIG